MAYNGYRRLRGRIIEKYGTQGAFAKVLGITDQTVTSKLAGRIQFSQDDIVTWCNLLGITVDDVGAFFFAEKLSKNDSSEQLTINK